MTQLKKLNKYLSYSITDKCRVIVENVKENIFLHFFELYSLSNYNKILKFWNKLF